MDTVKIETVDILHFKILLTVWIFLDADSSDILQYVNLKRMGAKQCNDVYDGNPEDKELR